MKNKLTIFLLLISFLISTFSWAQQSRERRFTDIETFNALLAIQVGIPSQEMQSAIKNNMGDLGFGVAIAALTNPLSWGRHKKNSPLRIGAEIGYAYYGRFLSDVNINGYRGNYKTSYGILQANGILRLLPSAPAPVRPFFEILAGGNFYLSKTKEDLSAIESALGIQSFDIDNYASASFNKGIAIGCNFGRKKRRSDDGLFVLRISYNWGDDIKYVVRNSLVYNGSNLQYTVDRAHVRYLMVQAGIGL